MTAPPEPPAGGPWVVVLVLARSGGMAGVLSLVLGRFVERALAELALDGRTDGVEVDAEGPQGRGVVLAQRDRRCGRRDAEARGDGIRRDAVGGEEAMDPAALLGEGEEEVDRAHLVGAEPVAEVLGRDHDGAGVSGEAFEHGSTSGRACDGRSAW